MATICVPVCVDRFEKMREAVKRAAEVGDVVELRLDCVDKQELAEVLENYWTLHESAHKPFIVTYRPAEQGGHYLTADERLDFWLHRSKFWNGRELQPADYSDIEAELLIDQSEAAGFWRSQLRDHRKICSHHDFVGVPHDLEKLYERMAGARASIIKLAVQADDAIDCLPILKLLERARREGQEMIAIAMGPAGILTRILGPSRGSFLTYGSLDDENATAAGQVTAKDLRELYRIDRIDLRTEIFGIIGKPVGHSMSPRIHNSAFAAGGVNSVFLPIEVHDVAAFIKRMVHPRSREIDWNLRGLSVTAPHKSAAIGHLDWIDEAAREIGAVNTIVIEGDELHGYNTDAMGFLAPLKQRNQLLEGLRCAVIGAGGAARAVVWALKSERANVTVLARDETKGETLAGLFGVNCNALSNAILRDFDVVINATPLGTRGKTEHETPATSQQLRGVRLAYDLVYNPSETKFLSEARAAGCETIGGLDMLIGQAVVQFKLWTGKNPNVDVMRAAAKRRLGFE